MEYRNYTMLVTRKIKIKCGKSQFQWGRMDLWNERPVEGCEGQRAEVVNNKIEILNNQHQGEESLEKTP